MKYFVLPTIAGIGLYWSWEQDQSPQPLAHEAYVWQREWGTGVGGAVVKAGESLSGLLCLAAEISAGTDGLKIRRIQVDHDSLRQTGRPVTAVIRIFPSTTQHGWTEETMVSCDQLLREIIDAWTLEHPAGVGLQIDYDCPERLLADFHHQIRRWKALLPEVELTMTALPSWLSRPEFRLLAAEVPGYVMQVHSLHLPDQPGHWAGLCDPVEIRTNVNAASALGIPFRLALPTYSCLVVFDEAGKIAEVYGEDLPEHFPVGAMNTVAMDSDAYLLSDLLKTWERKAPPELQGIVWYRLPTPGDRLNWEWPVLESIINGVPLVRRWTVEVKAEPEGYHRLVLRQDGAAPDDLPALIRLRIPGGKTLGFDGLSGYVARSASNENNRSGNEGVVEWYLTDGTRQFQKPSGWSGVVGWCRWEGGCGPVETEIVNR